MAVSVRYEVREGVAVVTIDNPPVNTLGPGVLESIEEAVARAGMDSDVRAVVLTGAGATFVAGADIRVFQTIGEKEASLARSRMVHARLRAIENCPKPLVAAINGAALGGGLEVAMACHFRIAASEARVGQPEVTLGLIPGAGGTQRLPRLAGVPLALEMCTRGHPVPAARALAAGVLDELVEGDLLARALAFARAKAAAGEIRRTRDRSGKLAEREAAVAACEEARSRLAKTSRGTRAPLAAVDAIEAGVRLGFDAGSEREIEIFAECVLSRESRNMVRLFFAEREAARVPGVTNETGAAEIRSAAVIGAGTMGGGIAMAYANAGIPVLLQDASQEALERGLAAIRRNYESSVVRGRLSREQMDRALERIRPTSEYRGFEDADVAIEAVFEDMGLKRAVFAELGRATRAGCILASNTSTLDIAEFAHASGRPESVAGHHFFSPANVMRLIEIVRLPETSPETIATSLKLAKKLGKIGVVVGNSFGFVSNRMLAYYMREAYLLLEEGATVSQIDAVVSRFGYPVGPFAMQDIAGIDVGARIRQYLRALGKTRAEGPQSVLPDRLFEMGRYGQKTGAGWYRYAPGSREPEPDPLIDELAAAAARGRGIERRVVTGDEILNRLMLAMINEGANILDDGTALRPGDIDVIYVNGFGFPRHRGGPMAYGDSIGLPRVLERVREYRTRLGPWWRPSPLLERLAASGKGFYGRVGVPG